MITDDENSFHGSRRLIEIDLLGRVYSSYYIPDGIHHDVEEMESGNLLVTTSDPNRKTEEDYIVEIDRSSGKIVNEIDLKK